MCGYKRETKLHTRGRSFCLWSMIRRK